LIARMGPLPPGKFVYLFGVPGSAGDEPPFCAVDAHPARKIALVQAMRARILGLLLIIDHLQMSSGREALLALLNGRV
jgi:hypothetical protein